MAGLNPAQAAAVAHSSGPLLVLAGAGSGKTRVITERISALITSGVPAAAILGVTFTNKAAREMRERVKKLIPNKQAARVTLTTFHSFGVAFLRKEVERLGYGRRFVILDQGDCIGIVREILKEEGIAERSMDIASLLSRISLWKNAFLAPSAVVCEDNEYDDAALAVYPHYIRALEQMHAVDFDDLIVGPVRILREHEDVRARWHKRYEHLLIDEFQDTNTAQFELVKLLTNERENLCVVGDDDQSIYGWRGAEVGNILSFDRHYPATTLVKLEENYRSKAQILEVANASIAASTGMRLGKTLRAARGPGELVRTAVLPTPDHECEFVAKEINLLKKQPDFRFDKVAILYRSNTLGKRFQEALQIAGIPFRVFGGVNTLDRKEIKDVLAFMRLLVAPNDELALRRVINVPPRGVGSQTMAVLSAKASQQGAALRGIFGNLDAIAVSDRAKQSIRRFTAKLAESRQRLDAGDRAGVVVRSFLEEIGFMAYIRGSGMGADAKRLEGVQQLLNWLTRFEDKSKKDALQKFVTKLSLRDTDDGDEETPNAVTLSSLHSSKGLEFDIVFFAGLSEGQLPHKRILDPKRSEAAVTDVEEERRLFYVGVTRARDLLYMTRPAMLLTRGREIPQLPSRFLNDVPEASCVEVERRVSTALNTDELADMSGALLAALQSGNSPTT